MHSVFFGGIAQYYDSAGILVQDNNVPFVNTIARVTRDASGAMAEYKLPVEMPSLLGASAEFIPVESVAQFNNGVFKLDDFVSDTTLVGYIYGGISSTAANIFFTNNGTQSSASSQIFKVYVLKNALTAIDDLNEASMSSLKLQVFPNPTDGDFTIKFYLEKKQEVKVFLFSLAGEKLEEWSLSNLSKGDNVIQRKVKSVKLSGTYFLTIETDSEKAMRKVIYEP
jgi:hypothetical protein